MPSLPRRGAVSTIATMPARIASGNSGCAATTAAKSGSVLQVSFGTCSGTAGVESRNPLLCLILGEPPDAWMLAEYRTVDQYASPRASAESPLRAARQPDDTLLMPIAEATLPIVTMRIASLVPHETGACSGAALFVSSFDELGHHGAYYNCSFEFPSSISFNESRLQLFRNRGVSVYRYGTCIRRTNQVSIGLPDCLVRLY